MAAIASESLSRGSVDFVESSVLEAIVPTDLDIDIERELNAWTGKAADDSGSILPFITQRQVLLLDEPLSVFVVFRTPLVEDELLKTYLERLVVNVEAFAFSTAPPPEHEGKASPPKELIYAEPINQTNEPLVLRQGEGEAAYTYVIWKVEIFIARPQGRFHKPAIYFQPLASFKPAEKPKQNAFEDEYLPSGMPTALNLLQPFENDPALSGVHPRLSAMRINKITPSAPVAREMTRPIRNGQRLLFRVLPALIWRMRYARVQASMSDLSIMASLDLEVAQYGSFDVRIDQVDLALHGGKVRAIAGTDNSAIVHKPGDQLTFLYNIKPDQSPDGSLAISKGHYLTMHVKANVLVSESCRPNISIEWKTPVDFANEHAPTPWKVGHRGSTMSVQDTKTANPDSLPAHDTQGQKEMETTGNNINVTLTVSGPPQVQVGKLFTWNVFIVNRSDKARKLAILVVAKRKKEYERHKSHPSASTVEGFGADKKDLIASAVLDENIVYAKQKSARTETAELICLTTDIRLGQLSPGSCYMADLKFLALSAGVLGVEAVRVVDLGTNETADVRDLPSIVAVETESGAVSE